MAQFLRLTIMNVYIIKSGGDVFLKVLKKTTLELETKLYSILHIKNDVNTIQKEELWRASALKNAIMTFEEDCTCCPSLKALINYINKIEDNDIVVLCSCHITSSDASRYQFICTTVKNGFSLEIAWNFPYPYEPTGRYSVHLIMYEGYKLYIGEKDKSKRVCRFCSKEGSHLFKNKSHAISAFLGNDYVFCNEECDECNHGFVNKIEKDLDNYYRVARSLDSHTNHNGKKIKVDGSNFSISNDGEMPLLTYKGKIELNNIGDNGIEISLEDNTPVDVSNIYKCLAKFVISSIPSSYLFAFKRTIEWITGKLNPRYLPPLYRNESINNMERPVMAILIRKDKKKDIPYCIARIAFLSNYYLFAIPYCQPHDVGNSMLKDSLRKYVDLCKDDGSYIIEDFNSKEKVYIVTNRTIYNENYQRNQISHSNDEINL